MGRGTRWAAGVGVVLSVTLLLAGAERSAVAATRSVRIARSGTIQAGDLPAAFDPTTRPVSRRGATSKTAEGAFGQSAAKFKECRAYLAVLKGAHSTVSASAAGPIFFAKDSPTIVTSVVVVFKTDRMAKSAVDAVAEPSGERCFRKVERAALVTAGESGGRYRAGHIRASAVRRSVPPVGDATVSYRIRVTMRLTPTSSTSSASHTADVGLDYQAVRAGRAMAVYSFLYQRPLDEAVSQSAVQSAVERLQASQATAP